LRCWLANFEAKIPEVKKLGFDEHFIRLWRFYLTCCIASFESERSNVMQAELVHI
jgi:cyclopropane-fatty-acyl-phospholipid synthase